MDTHGNGDVGAVVDRRQERQNGDVALDEDIRASRVKNFLLHSELLHGIAIVDQCASSGSLAIREPCASSGAARADSGASSRKACDSASASRSRVAQDRGAAPAPYSAERTASSRASSLLPFAVTLTVLRRRSSGSSVRWA